MSKVKEKRSVKYKIWMIAGMILCLLMIPIVFINCTLIFRGYTNSEKVPGIGGIVPMIVLTDSMYPSIQSGDLILCHREDAEKVQVGDVIAFFNPDGSGKTVVTHRVAEITKDENGSLAWVTKGDANNTKDPTVVPAKNLVGVYQRRFAKLGDFAMFMQTTEGMLLCVVCPILLLFLCDKIRRRVYENASKKETDALLAELELLRAEKRTQEADKL